MRRDAGVSSIELVMCGIAGAVDLRPDLPSSRQLVQRMTDLIAHRGPDGAGMLVDGPAVLGHRRLSIIDLTETGHQPLGTDDQALWITYNGEIYNYLELADELRARGHVLHGTCDTEVLLHAYTEWGEDALARLNGMFAFAIWDRRHGRLFCARDRIGVKPFYYTVADGRFLFASEVKSLLLDPGVERAPNDPRVLDFLVHGLADHTPETMFAGILQLPPGCSLTVEAYAGAGSPRRWYTPTPGGLDGDGATVAVRERLRDSVALRLRSDVPVGTCLSGGLDSSSVVTLIAELRREGGASPPDSFTATCVDPRLDESRYVEHVLSATGARNHTVLPDDDDLVENLDVMLWHMDEPFHGPSVYGHWKVMELARQTGVTVLLDGQGGDEVFAGYHHMYPSYLYTLLRRNELRRAWSELRTRSRVHGRSVRHSVEDILKLLLPRALRHRSRPPWIRPKLDAAGHVPGRLLEDQQLSGLTVSPLPAYLHHEDRNSMAFAIEARVPFLDYRVVEAGLGLAPGLLLRDGLTKHVLREAMRGTVPDAIVDRGDKQGFSVDSSEWLTGTLGRAIDETLTQVDGVGERYFDAVVLAEVARRPAAADQAALWRAFAVVRWLRLFFGADLVAPEAPASAPRSAHRAGDNVVQLRSQSPLAVRA